ncbi:ATP-dependent DNA helicase RecG [Candidatus Falkowbacteria bacterium]|nr:ATP-dependent DNA helicase RecG [Candidatus Falkowbacteria bacterium]
MFPLNTPIEKLSRVGKVSARYLKSLGIFTALDLIYNFPYRYEDYSSILDIKDLKPEQTVTIRGKIITIKNRRSFRKKMYITEAIIEDITDSIKVVWFNQPFLIKNLRVGDEIFISGKVESDNLLGLQFVSPIYEKINGQKSLNTAKIVPIYSLSGNLTIKQLRFLVNQALNSVKLIKEFLPEFVLNKNKLIPLKLALKEIHFPKSFKNLEKARYRLKFDELFLIALRSQQIRKYLAKSIAPAIQFKEKEIKEFVDSLNFKLTDDQKKAAWQILLDMEKKIPMNRLLEGDVGSGKTIVAALAILNAILSGYQAVFMAPTEILAKQHFLTLKKLFSDKIKIALLTSSEKTTNYLDNQLSEDWLLAEIKNKKVDLIIGTHALIEDKVEFNNLGLAIIDEQHRFGVEQRKKIKEKSHNNKIPHFLSMTATPIPRSLALILYGDLDLSIIKEMPKGRKKIITKLVSEENRIKAYQFIKSEIKKGQQTFVICPLIDPSDKLGVKSVTDEYKKLSQKIFPDLKIGLLHGKLKSDEKDEVMKKFKENKIQILVSTSVIEVGIDIPNATIMMIEGAERFGLAQLHQFRGRVGRGEYQSYCFLFCDNTEKTAERLSALTKSNDGFTLAEYDLKFRGPGEVYGLKQSGMPDLKIASFNDIDLIYLSKKEAKEFLDKYEIENFLELSRKLKEIKMIDHLE